jgi:3',5'-cyclic AMP phosphodiesterase CpdA
VPTMRRAAFVSCVALIATSLSLFAQELTLPLKPDSVRFAVIGDMGTGKKPQYEVAEQMIRGRLKFFFEFVIALGDNLYGGSKPSDYKKKFEQPYKLLLDAGVQFYAVLGNHDNPNERFYKPFNMNGQKYYTYKKNNVRFFALDSNYMNPQQLSWLENELQNSGSDWKICYFHHPLYSSGAYHGSSTELRLLLEPLFIKYGVQVVFAGHDHVYERVKPHNDIYYFTEGASGSLRRGNLRKKDLTAAGYDRDRSFMLVEIAGDELYFQTISRTGLTVDSGVIQRVAKISDAASQPAVRFGHGGRPGRTVAKAIGIGLTQNGTVLNTIRKLPAGFLTLAHVGPAQSTKKELVALSQLKKVKVRSVTIPQWSGGKIDYARLIHSKYLVVDGTSSRVGSEN